MKLRFFKSPVDSNLGMLQSARCVAGSSQPSLSGLGPGLCSLMPVLRRPQLLSWRAWEPHWPSDSKRSSHGWSWQERSPEPHEVTACWGSRYSSRACPGLQSFWISSFSLQPGCCAHAHCLVHRARPRDSNSSQSLPGERESMSWLWNQGAAFMAAFYFMPWDASGWAGGQGCWDPSPTWFTPAFLLSVCHTGSRPKSRLKFFGNPSLHWKK